MVDRAAGSPVDLAVAMRWLGGDQHLLAELVGIFVDDGPKRLQAIRAALTASDVQLEEAAHERHTENSPDLVAEIARELERVMAFFADPAWKDRIDLEETS